MVVISLLVGALVGAAVSVYVTQLILRHRIVNVWQSIHSMDETVERIRRASQEGGWALLGEIDVNEALAEREITLSAKVRILRVCHLRYTQTAIETDIRMTTLVPCTISVWENQDGKVRVAHLDPAVTGPLVSGGPIKMLGSIVSRESKEMLERVTS